MLGVLDTRISASHYGQASSLGVQRHSQEHSLDVLLSALRVFYSQYDGVDWIAHIVRSVVGLIQPHLRNSNATIGNWRELLITQPRLYLQLVIAVDLSLGNGAFPARGDFPFELNGLFTADVSLPSKLPSTRRLESEMKAQAPNYEANTNEDPKAHMFPQLIWDSHFADVGDSASVKHAPKAIVPKDEIIHTPLAMIWEAPREICNAGLAWADLFLESIDATSDSEDCRSKG